MNESVGCRKIALDMIQKEYKLNDKKLKEMTKIISKASIDDVERMLNAFMRFGIRDVMEAVGANQKLIKETENIEENVYQTED